MIMYCSNAIWRQSYSNSKLNIIHAVVLGTEIIQIFIGGLNSVTSEIWWLFSTATDAKSSFCEVFTPYTAEKSNAMADSHHYHP